MKIRDIIDNNRVTVSFEVFPPKQWDKIESTKESVKEMAKLNPAFMSVTYGAGGTRAGYTREIANAIEDAGITALSHLTCVSSSKEDIHNVVNDLKADGIENILALRGDIPEGLDFESASAFHHASDLAKEIKTIGDFCVGGACYPECHPESANRREDVLNLKKKVECGVDFLTTQMFFDNEEFLHFYDICDCVGIDVPIVAGIMPITNANQIKRSLELSNSSLPKKFDRIMDRFGDKPESMKQAGIVYATEQIIDLMANGINNVHIYTMNKPDVAGSIMRNLSDIINE